MLNFEDAMRVGLNACIEKIGHSFVQANRESAASGYGKTHEGVYCFVRIENRNYCCQLLCGSILDTHRRFRTALVVLLIHKMRQYDFWKQFCPISIKGGFPA